MGRHPPRLFKRAGLTEVAAEPLANIQTDHARGMALFEMETYAQSGRKGPGW